MNPLYVVHSMGRCGSVNVCKSLENAGMDVRHIHRIQGEDVNLGSEEILAEKKKGRPVWVITLVREPVARNLSAYWLNYVDPIKPQASMEHFLDVYPHETALEWMPEQLTAWNSHWDYKSIPPGVVRRGYAFGANILYLRTRDLTRVFSKAMAVWTGHTVKLSGFRNTGNRAEEYINFIRDIDLPWDYLDRMYGSDYTKTFFSEKEIKVLYNIWRKR